jgi:hypothetical protein
MTVTEFKYYILHGKRREIKMVYSPWDKFITWLYYRHSCVVITDDTNYSVISARYTWLNDTVGEMHEAWRWKTEYRIVRYDDIVIRRDRFYFRRSKDMTMFLLRWS